MCNTIFLKSGVLSFALFIFFILTSAAPSQATLMSINDPVFGIDSVTLQEGAGLEWLDVTATTYNPLGGEYSPSFNEMQGELLGQGGYFEGWRYASATEVENLFKEAGVASCSPCTSDDLNFIESVVYLLGTTDETTQFAAIRGHTSTFVGSEVLIAGINYSSGYSVYPDYYMLDSPDLHWHHAGHWLVRPVPEPSTLLLLSGGMFALWGCRKRSQP